MKRYVVPTMKEVLESEARNLFSVISTFAGCGGSSTGYRLAGGKVLLVNEFIPAAIETYKANYPQTIVLPDDIRDLKGKDLLDPVGMDPGELDVLDGSPPCASFSKSGKREKTWGMVKKYSDTKQRVDDLLFEFARVLGEVRPKVFLCENVDALAEGIAGDLLGSAQFDLFGECKNTIFHTLSDQGYRVDFQILNAAEFGVPQRRRRLFIMGVRKDLNLLPVFPKPILLPNEQVTVREALEGMENTEEELAECRIPEGCASHGLLLQMKEGESGDMYHPKGSFFNIIKNSWDRPACTILQTHFKPTIAGGLVHPSEMRLWTIREAKRLSSFPDDFILTGNYSKKGERIGRAVPPLLMKAVASCIYERILSRLEEGTVDDREEEDGGEPI